MVAYGGSRLRRFGRLLPPRRVEFRQRMFRAAIVGRPNVGKSTLFNRLVGARRSIVGDEPGITRDRIHGVVSWEGSVVELVDTGGMMPGSREVIQSKILEQVEAAIAGSDLLLW